MQRLSIKVCLFPACIGATVGAAVAAAVLLLGAWASVRLGWPAEADGSLCWTAVLLGSLAAGFCSGKLAGKARLLCGLTAGGLLWLVLLAMLREFAVSELVRMGGMLLAAALGAILSVRKRRPFKPGKTRIRVRPRRSF